MKTKLIIDVEKRIEEIILIWINEQEEIISSILKLKNSEISSLDTMLKILYKKFQELEEGKS